MESRSFAFSVREGKHFRTHRTDGSVYWFSYSDGFSSWTKIDFQATLHTGTTPYIIRIAQNEKKTLVVR